MGAPAPLSDHPAGRRKAVAALALKPGDTVLEVGAGTGRNLPYLTAAVGPGGLVLALDASPGMLAQARRLVKRRGWSNVQFLHQDAAQLEVRSDLDAVLFSLSYSVLPQRRPALARVWKQMRPGARIVVMDAALPDNALGQVLGPIADLLVRLAPGDPYSHPWDDLATFGSVEVSRFLLGLYFVCVAVKRQT